MFKAKKGGDVVSLFITYSLKARLDTLVVPPAQWGQWLPRIQGLHKVLLHQPCRVEDPFFSNQPEGAAEYVLQFFFKDLSSLEAASLPHGELAALIDSLDAVLAPQAKSQQAMVARSFPVDAQAGGFAQGAPATACTYLVAYYGAGQAHDLWLSEYIKNHVPLMARMPGIRAVEVYTQLDWLSELALPRANAIQRNKVVFDSPDGLLSALQSPLRAEMRADYLSLPEIGLSNTHEPMRTDLVFSG